MKKVKGSISERFLQEGNAFWFDGQPVDALAAYEKAVEALAKDAPISHHVDVKGAYARCL